MFSVYYVYSRSDVTRTGHKLQHTCSVYLSAHYDRGSDERTFAVFAGDRYGPIKLRRRLNLARGLAKMLYYSKACLLRSPYFVTLAVL